MSTLFFHPKRKSYYHRSIVPKRFRRLLKGRKQVWRSLKTADKDEAKARSAQWEGRVQRLFVELRRNGERMNAEGREALVAYWLEVQLDEAEDARALAGPTSEDYREGVWHVLSDQLDEAREALLTNNWRKIEQEADELLKSAGLPVLDHDGAEFGRLCRRLLLAKQEYLRIEADRWEGIYKDHRTVNSRSSVPGSTVTTAKPSSSVVYSKPFSEVVKLYFNENARAPRTDAQIRSEFEKFIVVIGGDRPVGSITKADCRTYKEHILKDRSLTTCVKHLSNLNALLKWSEAQGFMTDGSNAVRGLSPNKRQAKKQASQRRPFTDEELLTVLGSKDFKAQREAYPDRYWLVLLCLFQVCRREEAGQLAVKDIGEAEGITFLNITDMGEDQNVKNEGSKRRVPIHSSLIKPGFLEYVDRTKQAGHARLFPQLKKGGNGYSDAVGKFFSRLVTKCGFTDPALVLHGFRHGGITKLHGAGCPHNVCEMLAGHAAAGVHGQVYVHRDQLPLSLLRDGLEKLKYEEVVKALL